MQVSPIRALQRELGLTTIFVTHDQEEALTIADRLAIMHDGRVQQVGTSSDLYERPSNKFVADFLGVMNFLSGTGGKDGFLTSKGLSLPIFDGGPGTRTLGIRPERVSINERPVSGLINVPVRVTATIYKGSLLEVRAVSPSGDVFMSHLPNTIAASGLRLGPDERCNLSFAESDCHFFD